MQRIIRFARPHLPLMIQFIRFGIVGLLGFVVNTAVVYGTRSALGLYFAGALAYPLSATTTWAVNRIWTFRGIGSGAMHHQWLKFLAANTLGAVLNLGTYFLLVTISPLSAENPVIAVFAGAVAGMFVNFHLSRSVVFR